MHQTVQQYGVSVQNPTKVHETFQQMTQKLWTTKTWDLDKLFYVLVFYNISFSWLLPLGGFQFIFLLRDSENDVLANHDKYSNPGTQVGAQNKNISAVSQMDLTRV